MPELQSAPLTHAQPIPTTATPTAPVPKVNHLFEIAEIARHLHRASPSGAETAADQILEHVGALQDPKAYDARMAAMKKAEDDAQAERAKIREASRPKAKVA